MTDTMRVLCLRCQHALAYVGAISSLQWSFITFQDTRIMNLVALWSPYKQVAFEIIFTCRHMLLEITARLFKTFLGVTWTSNSSLEQQSSSQEKTKSQVWHSENRASWYILIIKANEMHYFSTLFGKELYTHTHTKL
jgi:hypothetical protein